MLGAEVGDQPRDFIASERIVKTGHFLAAVLDLPGNLGWFHCLTHVFKRRPFGRSLGVSAVAVSAALVAEERSACGLRRFAALTQGSLRA